MARFKASHGWPRLAEANQLGLGSAGPGQCAEPWPWPWRPTLAIANHGGPEPQWSVFRCNGPFFDLCVAFTREQKTSRFVHVIRALGTCEVTNPWLKVIEKLGSRQWLKFCVLHGACCTCARQDVTLNVKANQLLRCFFADEGSASAVGMMILPPFSAAAGFSLALKR